MSTNDTSPGTEHGRQLAQLADVRAAVDEWSGSHEDRGEAFAELKHERDELATTLGWSSTQMEAR